MQDERRLATINQPKITAFLAVREIVEKVGDKLRTITRMTIVQRLWIASLGQGNCAVCTLPYSNERTAESPGENVTISQKPKSTKNLKFVMSDYEPAKYPYMRSKVT